MIIIIIIIKSTWNYLFLYIQIFLITAVYYVTVNLKLEKKKSICS